MQRVLKYIPFAVASLAVVCTSAKAEETPINISYQPALYWSLPYYIATEKGWWKEVGLKPNFSTFPAGAPQVAASAAGSWDVGGTGSVPALLGAARYKLLTIGITNDESAANVLMATRKSAAGYQKNPGSMKGQKILLTVNSTGEYAVQACLQKYHLTKNDVQFVNLGQAQIISAISSNTGNLAGVWAPNNYTLEEKTGAVQLCSGKDAGVAIPGALVARADYARQHPDRVAKYLAVYLHTIAWEKAHPAETIQYMQKFYRQGGVILPNKYLQVEYRTRPIFDLAGQLRIMSRSHGASEVDHWFGRIGNFMKGTGTLANVPATASFITDSYLQMVAKDAKLRNFANDAR